MVAKVAVLSFGLRATKSSLDQDEPNHDYNRAQPNQEGTGDRKDLESDQYAGDPTGPKNSLGLYSLLIWSAALVPVKDFLRRVVEPQDQEDDHDHRRHDGYEEKHSYVDKHLHF